MGVLSQNSSVDLLKAYIFNTHNLLHKLFLLTNRCMNAGYAAGVASIEHKTVQEHSQCFRKHPLQ